jgi:hypothetical protein
VPDPLLQDRVGRQADGIPHALRFQQLVELGLGEGRVATEIENKAPAAIAGDHRRQDGAPIVGAMDVAGPQGAALQIPELVEDEQRMVAGAAEVAVVGRALLLAVGRALRAVQIEDDAVRRPARVHPVDPGAGQSGERREVGLGGQPLGLEAAHLAGRGCGPVKPLTPHDGAHGRIAGEAVCVVDVFVAGQPAVDRLPHEAEQPVADVLPVPAFGESRYAHRGQIEGVVQLTVGEQAAVRGDRCPMELELEPAVEGNPQRLLRFTRRVRHNQPIRPLLCLCSL